MTIRNLFAKLSLSPSLWRGLGGGFSPSLRATGIALLFLFGTSGLMAQSTDPFGDFDESDYFADMRVVAQVVMDGNVISGDAVLAVYSGNQLRGKAKPDPKNTEVFYLSIYSDDEDKLIFKVYTGGRVIEYDPGDFIFSYFDIIGTTSAPYIINIPAPVVTTPSTEGWATTCVPFNAEVPEGVTVWNVTGIEKGQLVMSKTEGNILPKDTPVLLYSEGKTSYEWLSRVADGNVKTDNSILKGSAAETAVAAGSVMTLGHSKDTGEIGFWLYNGTTVPANRAYIADFPSNARGFALFDEGVTTGVYDISSPGSDGTGICYDLQGRRTDARPSMWKKNDKGQKIMIR